MANTLPGTWKEPHREEPFPPGRAQDVWTEEAIPKLDELSKTPWDYILYSELGAYLFEVTGVHTTNWLPRWIRHTLWNVLVHCHENGRPATPALVVRKKTGMVGPGFTAWLELKGRTPIKDLVQLEEVAARERLECYRMHTDLPKDTVPFPTRKLAKKLNQGTVEWSLPFPTCSSCGAQMKYYEPCPRCRESGVYPSS